MWYIYTTEYYSAVKTIVDNSLGLQQVLLHAEKDAFKFERIIICTLNTNLMYLCVRLKELLLLGEP